jgi:DNA-binding HxlR family transcriptional regulator
MRDFTEDARGEQGTARRYSSQQGCPVAQTLDVIGDRWTPLIVRDLVMGSSGKFKDLLASLEGISPNLLANRLKRLEDEGIVERSFYSEHPPRAEYRLTGKGRELGAVVRAIAEWGYKHRLTAKQRASWIPPWEHKQPSAAERRRPVASPRTRRR